MKDLTDITFLIDRSGSIVSIRSDMEGGFNTFIEEQKQVPGDAVVSVYMFDSVSIDEHYVAKPLSEVSRLSLIPRGATPLLDAIGIAVSKTGKRLSDLPEDQRPNKVIFIIITDGLENDSKEYNQQQIKEIIEHQTTQYQWQFVYLGANQDAITVGTGLGATVGTSCSFSPTTTGVSAMYQSLTRNVSEKRNMSKAKYDASLDKFFDEN